LTKIPLIYGVSYFNLRGLGALFWGAKPSKDPHGDRNVEAHNQGGAKPPCKIFRFTLEKCDEYR